MYPSINLNLHELLTLLLQMPLICVVRVGDEKH